MTVNETSLLDHGVLVASRSPLASLMEKSLRDRCAIATGAKALVAVSGGPDSVALAVLAAALTRRRTPAAIVPVIAHVDHGLRSESVDEAAGVRQLATRLGLPCIERTVTVRPAGEGIAAAARQARYAALLEMALEVSATAVLTAHHAMDQAETMLLALARGSGLDGVAAMPWVRSLGDGVALARPLLSVEPQALLELLEEAALPSCQDPGNHDCRNPRAMVRHEVLPRLEAMYPGAATRIAATAQDIRELVAPDIKSSSVRCWSKLSLCALQPAACARTIRNAVVALDPSAGGCSRSVWEAIAGMIRTETCETRVVDVTNRIRCVLDARDVRLEEIGDE